MSFGETIYEFGHSAYTHPVTSIAVGVGAVVAWKIAKVVLANHRAEKAAEKANDAAVEEIMNRHPAPKRIELPPLSPRS
jgi:hypothetical protein